MLRLIVLGSAAGGGFPQWNSNDAASKRARRGDPAAPPRTQSSIAVSADDRHWVLFNASPDLRQQINSNAALHPQQRQARQPDLQRRADQRRRRPCGGPADAAGEPIPSRSTPPGACCPCCRPTASSMSSTRNSWSAGRLLLEQALQEICDSRRPADRLDRRGLCQFPARSRCIWRMPPPAATSARRRKTPIGLKIAARDGTSQFYYVPGCAGMTGSCGRLKSAPARAVRRHALARRRDDRRRRRPEDRQAAWGISASPAPDGTHGRLRAAGGEARKCSCI